MARKMKLVSEDLYNKFMNLKETDMPLNHQDQLVKNKKNILSSSDLTDDLKAMFYNEISREIYEKKMKDLKRPILVKNVEEEKSVVNQPTVQPAQTPAKKNMENVGITDYGDILANVNSKRATPILSELLKIGITANQNKNIIIGGQSVKGSNIEEILNCLINSNKSREQVIGLSNVFEKIKKSNISLAVFPDGIKKLLNKNKTSKWATLK
jgi:hypothetical protein